MMDQSDCGMFDVSKILHKRHVATVVVPFRDDAPLKLAEGIFALGRIVGATSGKHEGTHQNTNA